MTVTTRNLRAIVAYLISRGRVSATLESDRGNTNRAAQVSNACRAQLLTYIAEMRRRA